MSTSTVESRWGRGKKEMTSYERVANWVNHRDARRINRERWTRNKDREDSAIGHSDKKSIQDTLSHER